MSSLETLAKELIIELEREDHQKNKESIQSKSTGLANALHKFLHKLKGGKIDGTKINCKE